jgi:adenosylcobinamide-GDP ribazoletransferase
VRGFGQALAFLTVAGRGSRPSPRAVAWFGPVGLLIGLALGGAWWVFGRAWPALVAAALVVAADLALTGMLHFDGLVDAADGLLPHLAPARRLEVMRTPDIGAFGVAVAGAVLLLRWSALAAIRPAPLLLGAIWCASRAGMGLAMAAAPYAGGPEGLAQGFLRDVSHDAPRGGGGIRAAVTPAVVLVAAVTLGAAWRVPAGPVAVAAGVAAGAGVVGLGYRRLGGYTGDVLGAAGVVAETIGLVVAAARW